MPLLTVLGCVSGEVRDLTPEPVRLGIPQGAQPRELPAPAVSEARGYLWAAPLVQPQADGTVRVRVVLAGTMPRLSRVRWTATGAAITPDGLEALLQPEGGPWAVRAELVQAEQRVLDVITTGGEPGGILVTATADRLLVGAIPPGSTLEIQPALVGGAMLPGQTVSVRARHRDGTTTPWSSATAGGLFGAATLPDWPGAGGCDDVAFPAQLADGYVACAEPGAVTSWRGPGRGAGVGLVRTGSRPGTLLPPAGRTAVVEGPDAGLIIAGKVLGGWREDGSFMHFLGGGEVRGRPSSDGLRLAFARYDRVEVGSWGSPARVQVPARPSDVERPVATGGRWLAIIEGETGHERLRVRDLDRRRGASLTGQTRPREPGFTGPWVHWITARGLHAVSTEGWSELTETVASAPGRPASVDDWLVVAVRGGGLRAVHLPTGLGTSIPTGPLTELRGSGVGKLTTVQQPSDGRRRLVSWQAALRVFEEDGGAASGSILRRRAGGHGGSTGLLLPDSTRTLRFDPGPSGGTLEAWVWPARGPWASIELQIGGQPLRAWRPPPPGDGSSDEPGGWVRVGRIPPAPDASPTERIVQVVWTSGPQGGLIDAVRLLPPELRP
jgi:hypothetical protein